MCLSGRRGKNGRNCHDSAYPRRDPVTQSVRCTLACICRLQRGPIESFTVESSTCSRQTDQSVYRNVFSPDASHVPINGNRAILPASVLNLSKFQGGGDGKITTCACTCLRLRMYGYLKITEWRMNDSFHYYRSIIKMINYFCQLESCRFFFVI